MSGPARTLETLARHFPTVRLAELAPTTDGRVYVIHIEGAVPERAINRLREYLASIGIRAIVLAGNGPIHIFELPVAQDAQLAVATEPEP